MWRLYNVLWVQSTVRNDTCQKVFPHTYFIFTLFISDKIFTNFILVTFIIFAP